MSKIPPKTRQHPLHCWPAVAVLAAFWLPPAAFAAEPAEASVAVAQRAAPSQADGSSPEVTSVTGKVTTSPVLGAQAPDGEMGGTIPSAVPGWTPNAADAKDAFVYVPGRGWLLGDTRAERR